MVGKTEAKEKKATPVKATAKATAKPAVKKTASKTASSKKLNKGDMLACELCGLSVMVDECGDVVEAQEIICCDQPMKQKPSKAKATKK
jgi:hypothetical protein